MPPMRRPAYKAGKVLHGKPICLRTMLLATRHKRTHPALTAASKAGSQLTYP